MIYKQCLNFKDVWITKETIIGVVANLDDDVIENSFWFPGRHRYGVGLIIDSYDGHRISYEWHWDKEKAQKRLEELAKEFGYGN